MLVRPKAVVFGVNVFDDFVRRRNKGTNKFFSKF